MSEPVFLRDGDAFVATGHARGPWDPRMQHGGAPGALMARAIEALAPEMQLARITVDFLGAVPIARVTVEARIVRGGRRFQLAEATLSTAEGEACRARAVLLRRARLDGLPAGTAGPPLGDGPGAGHVVPFFGDPEGREGFHLTAMEIRFTRGAFVEEGPATAWFRLARPLVEGEEPSPAQRAIAAADFGNGISHVLDWGRWLFVNTDLTVQLHRQPDGEWVALDARTAAEPNGSGLAVSTIHDVRGPAGTGQQTLFVDPR